MKRYKYKNIICFQSYGLWYADYNDSGTRYALHRYGTKTRVESYDIAKENVDYMNRR